MEEKTCCDNAKKVKELQDGLRQIRETLGKKAALSFGNREKALNEALKLVKLLMHESGISE